MKLITSTLVTVITAASMLVSVSTASAAQNTVTGVLGLYKVADPTKTNFNTSSVEALGCKIIQKGVIGAAQGDIGLEQPNQFVLFNCLDTILGNPSKRKSFAKLTQQGKTIAVLDGDFMSMPNSKRWSKASDRQYVIKIGHYNNKDINKRDGDLATLTSRAEQLKDAYITESFIGVNHALGLATPDEAVILYYNSAAEGERFRKNNPKLMKKIGQFNEAHLVGAVYYIGQVVQ